MLAKIVVMLSGGACARVSATQRTSTYRCCCRGSAAVAAAVVLHSLRSPCSACYLHVFTYTYTHTYTINAIVGEEGYSCRSQSVGLSMYNPIYMYRRVCACLSVCLYGAQNGKLEKSTIDAGRRVENNLSWQAGRQRWRASEWHNPSTQSYPSSRTFSTLNLNLPSLSSILYLYPYPIFTIPYFFPFISLPYSYSILPTIRILHLSLSLFPSLSVCIRAITWLSLLLCRIDVSKRLMMSSTLLGVEGERGDTQPQGSHWLSNTSLNIRTIHSSLDNSDRSQRWRKE